jgi:hypothetical protein
MFGALVPILASRPSRVTRTAFEGIEAGMTWRKWRRSSADLRGTTPLIQ